MKKIIFILFLSFSSASFAMTSIELPLSFHIIRCDEVCFANVIPKKVSISLNEISPRLLQGTYIERIELEGRAIEFKVEVVKRENQFDLSFFINGEGERKLWAAGQIHLSNLENIPLVKFSGPESFIDNVLYIPRINLGNIKK